MLLQRNQFKFFVFRNDLNWGAFAEREREVCGVHQLITTDYERRTRKVELPAARAPLRTEHARGNMGWEEEARKIAEAGRGVYYKSQ